MCFFKFEYGNSVVLVTLTATFWLVFVEIEWEISRLAVSVIFSRGVTVFLVFNSDGLSTKAVIFFVVLGCVDRASSMMIGWGFKFASHEVVLTCIVKCGACMRLCVLSSTTLLFLIKCKPMIGPVSFFITTKC